MNIPSLNASDLVFIDPVATGFSRVSKDEKADQFFGDESDLNAVGEFIRLWTTRHERWLSPKYLCGESYGVFRAAGLAEHLNAASGMYLNGRRSSVSGVLDFGTIWGQTGNDLPYTLVLPAYTAAAESHHKLPPDLQTNLTGRPGRGPDVRPGDYLSALRQGGSLSAADRQKIVAELVRLTGLKQQVIEDNNLRIDEGVFRKQLLHDQGLILGVYDARITGRDGTRPPPPGLRPSSAATRGPFASAINSYVRSELKFEDDLPYEMLAGVQPWNYGVRNNYANASDKLAAAMNQNPWLRVLVLGGRCDLVCPIDTMHHALDHMTLDASYRTTSPMPNTKPAT